MKEVDVCVEALISAPIEIVSRYASDPDNAPHWYANIKSSEWKSPKPLRVGSQISFQAHFLGRSLEYTYEVVEFIPKEKLVMQTADGPFPMKTIYTWEPVEGGNTLMRLRNMGRPSGFSKYISPFLSLMMRKANTKDLQSIKKILERSAHS